MSETGKYLTVSVVYKNHGQDVGHVEPNLPPRFLISVSVGAGEVIQVLVDVAVNCIRRLALLVWALGIH